MKYWTVLALLHHKIATASNISLVSVCNFPESTESWMPSASLLCIYFPSRHCRYIQHSGPWHTAGRSLPGVDFIGWNMHTWSQVLFNLEGLIEYL